MSENNLPSIPVQASNNDPSESEQSALATVNVQTLANPTAPEKPAPLAPGKQLIVPDGENGHSTYVMRHDGKQTKPSKSNPSEPEPPQCKVMSLSPKQSATVYTLIELTSGIRGANIRLDELLRSLRVKYPGARQAFLSALVGMAVEQGVVKRRKDQDGLEWVWLSPAKVQG